MASPPEDASTPPADAASVGVANLFTRRNAILAGVGSFALLAFIGIGWLAQGGRLGGASGRTSPEKSIAVLPFEDRSSARDQQYFVDGLSEEIINALTLTRDLKVSGRASTFLLAEQGRDIATLANTLGVANVLEGSVRKEGEQIRVTATLIDAESGVRLWSNTYDRELTGVFAVRDEIAREVMGQLQVALSGEGRTGLVAGATESPEAYDAYLTGRFFWNQGTQGALRSAIGEFERAIELDPQYAEAYVGLADSYNMLRVRYSAGGFFDPVRKAAERAVDLAPDLPTAHRSLGGILTSAGQWERAEREYELTISLSPGYALAHSWLGIFKSLTGRLEEGLAHVQRAIELDPVSHQASVAGVFERLRQYGTAASYLRRAIELSPDRTAPVGQLGRVLVAMGDYDEAERVYAQYFRLLGVTSDSLANSERLTAYERYAERGYTQLIDPAPGLSLRSQAWHFVRTGQVNQALEALEVAITADNGYWLIAEFNSREVADLLRDSRRYQALLAKAGITW
jgi:adenylate cyclase